MKAGPHLLTTHAVPVKVWRRFYHTVAWRLREAGTSFHIVSATVHAMVLAVLLLQTTVSDIRGESLAFTDHVAHISRLIAPPDYIPEPIYFPQAGWGHVREAPGCGGGPPRLPHTLPEPAFLVTGEPGRAGTEVSSLTRPEWRLAIEMKEEEARSTELARAAARERVQSRGLLRLMNQPESALGLHGSTGLDAVSALGALDGAQIGESWGSRGLGAYGGGLGALGGIGRTHRGGFDGDPVVRRRTDLAGNRITRIQSRCGTGHIVRPVKRCGMTVARFMDLGEPEIVGELDRAIVQRVVRENRRGIRACYESALQRNQNLEGRVTLRWLISPEGTVAGASVETSTLNSQDVENCLVTRVRQLRFPGPVGGGIVRVSFPFEFAPRG
jgi:TonB family protein